MCTISLNCAKLTNEDIEKFIDIHDETCSNKTNTDKIVLTDCKFNSTITKLSGSYYIELDVDKEFDGDDEIKDKINKYKSKVEFLVETNDGKITITQRKDH